MSVYPKKECPFFIVFVACLFTFTGTLAVLTHYNPDVVMAVARNLGEVRLCCNSYFHCATKFGLRAVYFQIIRLKIRQ